LGTCCSSALAHGDAGFGQGLPHPAQVLRSREDLVRVPLRPDVLRPRLQGLQHQFVLRHLGPLHLDHALQVEHPGHGPGLRQAALVAVEHRPDFRRGAVAVIRGRPDQNGHPSRAVPLVSDLLVVLSPHRPGAAGDGTLDVLVGHPRVPGAVDGVPQPDVGLRVPPALPRGHDDLPGQLAEQPPPDFVHLLLLDADVVPLGVPCHTRHLACPRPRRRSYRSCTVTVAVCTVPSGPVAATVMRYRAPENRRGDSTV
jgi:hypothetical protein